MAETATRMIRRPKRWDQPFGPDLTDEDVDAILKMEPFASMDQSRFPNTATLRDIVSNDTRLLHYQTGDIIVRAGDHGTSTFLVMQGTVRVVLHPGLPNKMLGRADTRRKSVWEAVSQIWTRPRMPEVRDVGRLERAEGTTRTHVDTDGETRTSLADFVSVIEKYHTVPLGKGEMFGEIAALTRTPRTSTIFAEDDVTLLEIRRPGIRDIRQRVDTFKRHIDQLYRERSLIAHLRESWIFKHLDDETLDVVVKRTLFETYGDFDWQQAFMRVAEGTPEERIEKEPVIVREGDYPDGLLMIRSGFARVSYQVDQGHRTLSYLGGGALFGLNEIVHNWRNGGEPVPLQYSLRAVGYSDVLRVPTRIIEEHVLPKLPEHTLPRMVERRKTLRVVAHDRRQHALSEGGDGGPSIPTDVTEFMVDNRYINGTKTMLIDMDRCVRCDACSEACAVGHNNNPRFNRHGRRIHNVMVANACMHCFDPVCMLGCPTGAIHRVEGTGQVVVNDDTCIGCATCANNCPYDNIRMVEVRNADGEFVIDELTGQPVMKSTKCDLCADQIGGPACQRACPHDALVRMDMSDVKTLAEWLNR